MKSNLQLSLLITLASLAVVPSSQAQSIVYDNLGTAFYGFYAEPNINHPIFGDTLNLTRGGQLGTVGLSVYNSSFGGNAGSILEGTMTISIYDNTTPYVSGALSSLPLLGTATESLGFGTGLRAGSYAKFIFDLSSLDINLTQNILITQQFTETSGTSPWNGVPFFGNPTIGSSPPSVYIGSDTTVGELYTLGNGNGNPGQFGYQITIVPEPSTLAFAGFGIVVLVLQKRK